MARHQRDSLSPAYRLILMMGVVSLFGDIAYEGGRGATAPFFYSLGASAVVVGAVAGVGELLGYALRIFSGDLADRTRRYWVFLFLGYGLILAIPLLAVAWCWEVAALMIVAERVGKGIRAPARDSILAFAGKRVGRGWGFAIHEAMDQIGAVIGPLALGGVLFAGGGYRLGFSLLVIPALLVLLVLIWARSKVPTPHDLEGLGEFPTADQELAKGFWTYTLFAFLCVAGFANFQLLAYHISAQALLPEGWIPILYSLAMGTDAIVALLMGRLYDRFGLCTLLAIPLLTIPIPLLGFSRAPMFAIAGCLLWGAVMGIQETIMRAAIAEITPVGRRGLAYGIFNAAYGAGWFVGGAVIGLLYEAGAPFITPFVLVVEMLSLLIVLPIAWGGQTTRRSHLL